MLKEYLLYYNASTKSSGFVTDVPKIIFRQVPVYFSNMYIPYKHWFKRNK